MLTEQDITRMQSVFATKADLSDMKEAVLEAVGEMRNDILTNFDGMTTLITDLKMEYVAIKMQLDRHDRWIKALAEKAGLMLTQ